MGQTNTSNSNEQQTVPDSTDGATAVALEDWRLKTLNNILLFAVILGALPVVWSIIHDDPLVPLYLSILAVAATLCFVKKLGYTIRVLGILSLIYLIGASEFSYGITGGSRIYLLSFILLSGIFFNIRAGIIATVITVATIGASYYLVQQNLIDMAEPRLILSRQSDLWVHYTLGMLLMSGTLLMPLASLFNHLFKTNQTSNILVVQLRQQMREAQLTQKELRKSEARYRLMADNIMDIVWTTDLDLNLTFISSSIEKIIGYTAEELLGKRLESTILPEYHDRLRKGIQEIWDWEKEHKADPSRPFTAEMEIPCKNGDRIWIESKSTFVRDKNGHPRHLIGVSRDITLRKRAEGDRVNMENQVRQSEKLKSLGALAGGIAHDFNNILQAIFGYSDLALLRVDEENPAHEHLSQVKLAAKRADELVQQILMFSRKGTEEYKLLNIGNVVNEALELMRASLPSTIEIQKDIPVDFDPIMADASQIHQIMINLCTNAFHAMQDKDGVLHTAVNTVYIDSISANEYYHLSEGKYVCLTISDTGDGMPAEVKERIFEPFFTTKNVGEGTGLGLSTIHGIVLKHGGDITVDSKVGVGTTFNIYFPVVTGNVVSDFESDSYAPDGKEHVLFVDDEKNLAVLGKKSLEAHGYKVSCYSDSQLAFDAFCNDPQDFHIVITDQTMPRLTGTQLARKIKNIRPDIPVIMMSGLSNTIPMDDVRELGITHILNKPIRVKEISAAIRSHLDKLPLDINF